MSSSIHPEEQSVNAGGDGRVWLGLLESIDIYLHKPAPTDLYRYLSSVMAHNNPMIDQ